MYFRAVYGAALLCTAACVQAQPRALTIEEALRRAEEVNPAIPIARAQLDAGEAELREANALLWNNPAVSTNLARRRLPQLGAPDVRFNEWAVELSQAFETGGQSAQRRASASAARDALMYAIPDARRRMNLEVEQRFYRVLAKQMRLDAEREAQTIIERAATLATKRVEAGEDSRLDGNLARIEAERARNLTAAAREGLVQARAELASFLQWPLDGLPEVGGVLAPGSAPAPGASLVARVEHRADLKAARSRIEAARSRLELERSVKSPDVTVGIGYGRDGAYALRESVGLLTLSVPLPVFRRNEAGIARAYAELTQVEVEYRSNLQSAQVEVAGLVERYATLTERAARLRSRVLPPLLENIRLSERAQAEGEIAVPQLLIVSRQAVEARRELLEAETELRLLASVLAAATWTNQGDEEKEISK